MIADRYLDHSFELAGRIIDPVGGTVTLDGEQSSLKRKELEVLALLASAKGLTVPREDFIDHIWDGDLRVGKRALTDTVYDLRRSLKDSASKDPLIRTIPRQGYQLHAEARPLASGAELTFAEGWQIPGRPQWRLEELISESDVAETWLAQDPQLQEFRIFRFCRSEDHLRRLRREVTVLRFLREKLADHGSIAGIIDWRLDEPPYFLEMESARHGSLVQWSTAQGGIDRIPWDDRIRLITEVASALASLHTMGVVHRGLSPDSVLIDQDDGGEVTAKLGDFGLSHLVDRSELEALKITAAGLTVEAADSSGPSSERGISKSPDAAEDVYALALLLFQTVAGDWQRSLGADWQTAIASPTLRDLIAACVDDRKERRPSAKDLAQHLETFRAGGEGAAPSVSASEELETPETEPTSPAPASPAPLLSAPTRPSLSKTLVGQSIGPYRLLDVLGEGGMGTVYLAEQRAPVQRKVALKLIRAGMDSDQVLARFEAERQALALMDHDNVAAVYDAGTSASGHPYFVMEYVPGLDVTSHCDRSRLGLGARIELCVQICGGIQHAHQKGLIHRDLKPGNILVKNPAGEASTVKIIDFGVAKSLQRSLTDQTVHTRLGTYVGTPRYSSPEQIADHLPDVDTRSDVYSLGVVLYELIAGVTPHSAENLAGKSSLELAKILEDDPPTPQSRYSHLDPPRKEEIALKRSRSVAELEQGLHADLSWIVLKCLERDPDDRYASILELKKDLLRWLADEPIEARPATRLYRLRKLVKRHRTAVVLATLTTLTLLTTTVLAVAGFVRAQSATLEAEKAAQFQVKQLQSLDPAAMGLGIRQSLRKALAEQALPDGGSIPDEEQLSLDRRLTGVNFTDLTLEQLDQYLLEPALLEIEASYSEFPMLQTRLWQAMAEILMNWGDFERAAEVQGLALEGRRALFGDAHPLTLTSQSVRGRLRIYRGKLDDAETDLEAAIPVLRKSLGSQDLVTIEAITDLGLVYQQKGEYSKAESTFNEVLEILGDDHPATTYTLNLMGLLQQRQGRLEEAAATYRSALERNLRALGTEDLETIATFNSMGMILREQEKLDEAEGYYRKALAGALRFLGNEHPTTLFYKGNLVELLGRAGKFEEAEPLYRETLEAKRRVLGSEHPGTIASIDQLATFLRSRGELDEAEALYREAVGASRKTLGEDHPHTWINVRRLILLLRDRGTLDEAEGLAREVVEGRRRILGEDHPDTLRSIRDLGRVLRAGGMLDAAEQTYREVLEGRRRVLGKDHPDTLRSIGDLGNVLRARGMLDAAEQTYREALAGMQRALGEDAEATVKTKELLEELLREKGQLEDAAELEP